MKNSRRLFERLHEFVNTLDDNDLKKLCSGEYSIILNKNSSEKTIDTKKTKNVKKLKVEKKVNIDITKFENLHKEVLCCKSRAEAKKVVGDAGFKKDELLALGDFLNIKIPKTYNKTKMIARLVEYIVGNKIDDESM